MADKKSKPEEEVGAVAVESAAASKPSWLPTLAALILAPLLTWAVADFVLIPRLRAEILGTNPQGTGEAEAGADAAPAHDESKASHGAGEVTDGYRMENVVVNLSGSMGTRYLKASFLVTGLDPSLIERFEASRPQIGDVTLAVLSSLTLADLEEPGSKNIIRERLVNAYNQIFGAKVAENLYFSDFVVQ
jgi:flagellar FliL protein